jgi:hypothetical protein
MRVGGSFMEFEIASSNSDSDLTSKVSYGRLANRVAPDVQVVFKAAHDEMRRLIQQRVEITQRIGTIKQAIVGLCNLFGDDGLSDDLRELVNGKAVPRRPGITQACRKVLTDARCPLTARNVCEQIQQTMPDLPCAKNLLAEVTTVLSRLAQYGEARIVPCNGSRAWVWVSDVKDGSVEDESFHPVVPALDSQA